MALTHSSPRLAYDIAGDDGSPVLMIMGLVMRGVVWRPQVEAFSSRHRVVTFDNRGVGGSDLPRGPLTIRDMAEDALRLADELGLERFHLVGVSMGGMIAQEAALAQPKRLRSLALIATHAGGASAAVPHRPGIESFVRVNLARGRRARAKALAQLLYPSEFLDSVDRAALDERMHERTAMRVPRRTLASHLSAVFRHRSHDRLPGLEVPTLVIKPGRDVLIRPRESDRLGRLIPNAEIVEYQDAGHGVTFQHAERLNERLLEHFETHD